MPKVSKSTRPVGTTAAAAGATCYLLLKAIGAPASAATLLAMGLIFGLRMVVLWRGLHLPPLVIREPPAGE